MRCNTVINELIQENDDISSVHRIVDKAAEIKRINSAVARARRTGKYVEPSKHIPPFLDYATKLVGKSLDLESTNDYKFKFVKVKNAKMIGESVVSINNGAYRINVETKMTTDGSHYVSMGSKNASKQEGTPVTEVSGTMNQILSDLVNKTKEVDGSALKSDFAKYLENIFTMYQNVFMEASKDVELNVEFLKSLDEHTESQGRATPELGKIRLLMGSTRYRTNTEILAEELQHVLLKNAIKKHPELVYDIENLRKAMREELTKKYNGKGYELFVAHLENPTSTDVEIAKEQWDYAFENDTYPADEFLAHATTNEQLVKALTGIQTSEQLQLLSPVLEVNPRTKQPRKWAKYWNKIVQVINTMYSQTKFKGSAQEYAVSLLHKLLEVEHKAQKEESKGRYQQLLGAISQGDNKIKKFTTAIDGEFKNIQDELERSKKMKAKRFIDGIWKIRGLAKARSYALQNNVFSSVTKNMKNQDIAKFYELFRHSKEFVEKEVVAIRHRTANLLEEYYGLGKVEIGLRKAAKRVLLDADTKSLGDSTTIIGYLEDSAKVDAELVELSKEFSDTVLIDIDNTAELLVNNRSNDINVFTNATQIAAYRITTQTKGMVERLDRAITLRALQKLDERDKTLALNALKQEPKGFDSAMELVREEQQRILESAYKGNKMYQAKGAKQDSFTRDRKRYLVDKEEMEGLIRAKMHNLGRHEELSEVLGKDIYVVIGDSLDIRYTEGLLKVVQLSNEGDSLKYTMMKLGNLTEDEAKVRIEMLRKSKRKQQTTLVSERTGLGEIYDYRIRVEHAHKAKYMEMDQDIIATVGATVANLTHKQEAMLTNYASLKFLREFHGMYKNSSDHKFVEIDANSTGKFKEYWDMIPYYIKNDIQNSGQPLRVTESMLVDYFGYHDATIMNLPFIKNSKKRQLIAKKFEQVIMEMARYWKLQIVAFTGATVIGNNLSNMIVGLQHTASKNPLAYMQKYKKIWGMMNDYQKVRREKIDLELRKKAGENGLDRQIAHMTKTMELNPIHVIMEDGQYNVIFEDLNTSYFDNEGIIERKINETIKKAEGRNGRNILKTLVDTVYLRKDSAIHDSIMKLTTYSDAINKMIILMDAQERAHQLKNQRKTYEEIGNELYEATKEEIEEFVTKGTMPRTWLSYVDALHVNYGYLDNKYIKYANDMLFLSFTKYMFRIFPAMTKMIATKGLTVGLTEAAQKLTGIDVETPLDQFFDPIDSLLRKASSYTKPVSLLETMFAGPLLR